MAKKSTKSKLIETDKTKVEWELIGETGKEEVNKLIDFYKKDKKNARVVYHQDSRKYFFKRTVMFKKGKNFEIATFIVRYGISSNTRIYHSQKKLSSIIFKDNKFWQTNQYNVKRISQLNFYTLKDYISSTHLSSDERVELYKMIESKFSFIRWIEENQELWNFTFNTITTYKLKTPNDCLRHKYGVPMNIVKIVKDGPIKGLYYQMRGEFIKVWKEMKKVLHGVQNLTSELFNNEYFIDTCKMAKALDKKVNCSWSPKRLKEEHDKWSKEITLAILSFEELKELNVKQIYRDFAEQTGYRLLHTNKAMTFEGMTQNHCVATYISEVDRGETGIYHINGYTLQLVERSNNSLRNGFVHVIESNYVKKPYVKGLYINQFKGLHNKNAPEELVAEVRAQIDIYNKNEARKQEIANAITDDLDGSDEDIDTDTTYVELANLQGNVTTSVKSNRDLQIEEVLDGEVDDCDGFEEALPF